MTVKNRVAIVTGASSGIGLATSKLLTNRGAKVALVAIQCVIPYMQKQGDGVIINISSGTSLMALTNMGAYSSLKRALNGLSLTAREELAKDNISVSVVYPYITLTNFDKNMMEEKSFIEMPGEDKDLPPPDKAEYIAEKILQGIETGEAEIFAHDWMKELKK